jgi:integrase
MPPNAAKWWNMTKRGKRDFLFLRSGSNNWHIKLRTATGKRFERSLGTPDRQEAENIALPVIQAHKQALRARRRQINPGWVNVMEPGREHVADDGHRIIATARELIHVNADGSTRIEPNGGMGWTMSKGDNSRGLYGSAFTRQDLDALVAVAKGQEQPRPPLATREVDSNGRAAGDDHFIETYIAHRGVKGYKQKEVRDAWHLYKQLVGKPLKEATRDDARVLVKHFQDKGLKSRSVKKKIMWLTSAVNLAIDEGHLRFNPFKGVVPKLGDDSERRLPYDESDVKLIKRNIGRLSESDQLLLRLLATTGMRLGEAFQVEGEKMEGKARYVIVGSKTAQSLRRVPLPSGFPAIKGRLFEGNPHAASKRLAKLVRDIGITDPAKAPAHSWRHRAQDRLRAASCPEDIREALLGHEKKTVADGYGRGFPVAMLKQWMEKIGF